MQVIHDDFVADGNEEEEEEVNGRRGKKERIKKQLRELTEQMIDLSKVTQNAQLIAESCFYSGLTFSIRWLLFVHRVRVYVLEQQKRTNVSNISNR